MEKKNFWISFFWLTLLLGGYLYYHTMITYHPHGQHQWRQADGMSITLRYFNEGMDFFHPRAHNTINADGEAVSEFPILYYISALLFKVWGPQPLIVRLVHWLCMALGLYGFFRGASAVFDNYLWGWTLTLMYACSPLLWFYGLSFLPDAAANGLCLYGTWWCYDAWQRNVAFKWWFGIGIIALGAMVKISALLFPLAIIGACVLQWKRFDKVQWLRFSIGSAVVFICAGTWIFWAKGYNTAYDSPLFLTTIKPYWEASTTYVNEIRGFQLDQGYKIYFPKYLWWLLSLGIFTALVGQWKQPFRFWWAWMMFAGVLSYWILFFGQLNVHPYYQLVTLPIFVSFFALAALLLKRFAWFQWAVIPVIVFTLFQFQTGVNSAHKLYDAAHPDIKAFNATLYQTQTVQGWLLENRVNVSDRVISLPDGSPNITLHFLNRKGLTDCYEGNMGGGSILDKAEKGRASYLIINDTSAFSRSGMDEVLAYPLDTLNESLYLFDLRPYGK